MTETKKYHTGYVMGVFDLFHVGHLNLIKKAKERCEYLTVGLLTDEVTREIKHIRPTIPFEERKQVLESVRYVDSVVAIDEMKYLSKVEEWHRHPYDCLFSGDDYAKNPYWLKDREELRKLGSNIEFFDYYRGQSSSQIRRAMTPAASVSAPAVHKAAVKRSGHGIKVVIYGIGYYYNQMYKALRYLEEKNEIQIVALTQTDPSPYAVVDGIPVVPKEKLIELDYDYIIVCSKEHFQEIADSVILMAGTPRERILSYETIMRPEDSLTEYLDFVESRPTLISNTCWAGITYRNLNMKCITPFRNLWISNADYFRLIQDLRGYIESYEPVFDRWETDELSGIRYPVLRLGDIHLHCNHSSDPARSIDEWNLRKQRINWDNVIVEFYSEKEEARRIFSQINLPYRKLLFTTEKDDSGCGMLALMDENDRIGVDAVHKEFYVPRSLLRFNIIGLLDGHTDCVYRSLTEEESRAYGEE